MKSFKCFAYDHTTTYIDTVITAPNKMMAEMVLRKAMDNEFPHVTNYLVNVDEVYV